MAEPIDRESYLKGHEDAMRVVSSGEAAVPPEPPYGIPMEPVPEPAPARKGPSRGRRFAVALAEKVGEALGILVVFPVLIGVVGIALYWFFSDGGTEYEQAFVAGAGLAFLFGLFVLVVKWGWALLINFWPIVLVIVGVVIAWKALT
jgi:hypothetical protein